MSIDGYLGPKRGELRLKTTDVLAERVEGAVLEVKLSVEHALAKAAYQRLRPGARYRGVAGYDPVPRSHCRLEIVK